MDGRGTTAGTDARDRRILLALFLSLLAHAVAYATLTRDHPEDPVDAVRSAATAIVDVAIPGFGPPGAPAGDAPAALSTDEAAAPAAPAPSPRPRADRVQRVATAPAVEVAPEPEAPSEGEGQSNDAFLDSLMARADGRGTGAGGNGGSGCPDPVAGTWRAKRYSAQRGHWGVFTLRVERDGDSLSGTIRLHSWSGSPTDREPPLCGPGRYEHTVRMNASGRLEGRHFRMDALDHRETVHCMSHERYAYNLDHFTGTLAGNRILAVNNDGGWEVNAPYTFRRIACE